MSKKCSLTLLFFLLFMPLSLLAQEITVKGKVSEKGTGETLPGASVVVQKSTKGVMTDVDGGYEIKVKPTDKLVFSYVGMEDKVVTVGNQTVINVELAPKGNELDEVTVVAYGKQKKESIVSSITTVNAKDCVCRRATLPSLLPVTSPV